MKNTCPKCQKKLSAFYIKQNCPDCGCDLLYYDIENELEKDAQKAEAEFAAVDRILSRIKGFFNRIFKRKNDDTLE